jgi:hypothetical protein
MQKVQQSGVTITIQGGEEMKKTHGFILLAAVCVFAFPLVAYSDSITINFKNGSTVVYDQSVINSITFSEAARPSFGNVSGRDGHFIAYDNGTVLDTKTNLMWAAKDNGKDIKWADAKSYCENYRGGGYTDWRMPTMDELAGLYDAAKNNKADSGHNVHLTELIRLTQTAPWSSETRGSEAAHFLFDVNYRQWLPWQTAVGYRALPVRSDK